MSAALSWLPVLDDVDRAIAEIKAIQDPAERLRSIARIAGHQLDFVQTGRVDRLLEKTLAMDPSPAGYSPIKLAWLGTSTLDHLLPSARLACLRRGFVL